MHAKNNKKNITDICTHSTLTGWSTGPTEEDRGQEGMDQAKFAFPRHKVLKSKDFSTFQRPRAHVVGCLMHGRGLLFFVTNPDLPKDSSTHIEIVAHALSWLESCGESLRDLSVTLQCDNTVRECKNSVMLSFLASLTMKGTFQKLRKYLQFSSFPWLVGFKFENGIFLGRKLF